MMEKKRLIDDEEEDDIILEGDPPTLYNFVDYVEHGSSKDKDPEQVESEDDKKARQKLVKATLICFLFMMVEVIGGYVAGSLAIMTDAAHLLSDVAGFLISLFALYLSNRKATITLSYGFKRAEIVGAVLSVMLIWFLTGILLWEAIIRTQGIVNHTRDSVVEGKTMTIVALFGLLANMTLLKVLGHDHSHGPGGGGHGHSHGGSGGGHGHSHDEREDEEQHGHDHGHSHAKSNDHGHSHDKTSNDHGHSHDNNGGSHGHSHDLENGEPGYQNQYVEKKKELKKRKQTNINVSAAYVHAIGDLIQSVGVCIAGGLIWAYPGDKYPMVQLADPIATFLFSILVLFSTYEIMKTSMNVLMEGVPEGISPAKIAHGLLKIPGVAGLHHLHIWSLTVGEPSLSVHLVVKEGVDLSATLGRAQHLLREKNIPHCTIQIETQSEAVCQTTSCEGTPCTAYAFQCSNDSGNCFDAVAVSNNMLLSPH